MDVDVDAGLVWLGLAWFGLGKGCKWSGLEWSGLASIGIGKAVRDGKRDGWNTASFT